MKTIRHSVFETNSSSTHSISIGCNKTKILDSITPDPDGTITILPGEFGWGYEEFNDPYNKASYCYTWAKNYSGTPDIHLDMLHDVIKEHTGARQVSLGNPEDLEEGDEDYLNDWERNGSIDHQSSDTCAPAFASELALKMFIFHPDSLLVIDSDG